MCERKTCVTPLPFSQKYVVKMYVLEKWIIVNSFHEHNCVQYSKEIQMPSRPVQSIVQDEMKRKYFSISRMLRGFFLAWLLCCVNL